jgi:Tol biopolymer transport system component
MDLSTGGATQLTFEGTKNRYPVWTLDSRDVLFTSDRDGAWAIYRQAADGTGVPVRVIEGTEQLAPTDVLPGNVLLYQDTGEAGYRDILTFDLDDGGPATAFLATSADERAAQGSPDGAWIVYVSDSGSVVDPKVYVRPFPPANGGLRAIAEENGAAPLWSMNGDKIYFLGPPPSFLMSVPVVNTGRTITPGRPAELFAYGGRLAVGTDALSVAPYDILPNGEGIVAVELAGLSVSESQTDETRPRINVVLNWFDELRRLVPTE